MSSQDDFLRAKAERIQQRYGQKSTDDINQKPKLTDDEKELVNDLKNELFKYIFIGGGRPSEPLPPLEENEVVKRFSTSGLKLQVPPKPTIINYDMTIDDFVAQNPPKKLPALTPIGNTDPICPYCNAIFPKKPKAKTKCKSCSSLVFVRTRPLDGEKVLVTEAQAKQISAEYELRREIRDAPENERIYKQSISLLKRRLVNYQENGYPGWRLISVCDERCTVDEVNFHGRVFKFGSEDMNLGIDILCRRDCRVRTMAWFGDPEFDSPPEQDAWCRYDWAVKALEALPESERWSEKAQRIQAIIFRDRDAATRYSRNRK